VNGTPARAERILAARHFVRGALVEGSQEKFRSRDLGADFTTPAVDLNALLLPRSQMPPLANVRLSEIIDFLAECGKHLELDRNPYLQECLELVVATSPLPRRVIVNLYAQARHMLRKEILWAMVESSFADPSVLDEWVPRPDVFGQQISIRAFPPRMVHILAGNAPTGCVASIVQGALVKAVNLFKMPSQDPFTCVAILRTMAEVDPRHPLVQSMSAVYWQGGDKRIERMVYRPQFFDRIVAWGGRDAIDNVIQYLGPGIQLVSFDPKTSISMIGQEAFTDDAEIDAIADKAAEDVNIFNQDACLASRFIFVERTEPAKINRFCKVLQQRLGVERDAGSAVARPPPGELREQIEVMQAMDDNFTVWGTFDGRGMVILSDKPVDFHPMGKIANVVVVASLDDALRYVNVATQTIGVWPAQRKAGLRDRIASAGGQRLCRLGSANKHALTGSHDAMYPLQRFVLWLKDEDI
jgi:hypothetical protein